MGEIGSNDRPISLAEIGRSLYNKRINRMPYG